VIDSVPFRVGVLEAFARCHDNVPPFLRRLFCGSLQITNYEDTTGMDCRGGRQMPRFEIPTAESAPAEARATLDAIAKQLGFTPNVYRLMSISPAVLKAFTSLQTTLSKTLDFQTRDAIALSVSEVNGCHYCVAAHSYAALHVDKVAPEEIVLNRQGASVVPGVGAAARFVAKVVEARGHVNDGDLTAIRSAGFTDAQILEMVALSAQYSLTNFINSVAGTEIDFPLFDEPVARA
jgi:uncharacterized peroxidase-related enzyme